MHLKVVAPNGRVCTDTEIKHRHQNQRPNRLCPTPMQNLKQHHAPVRGYRGFLAGGSSGHPPLARKGPAKQGASSLPPSAWSSPQTPREGLGEEEVVKKHKYITRVLHTDTLDNYSCAYLICFCEHLFAHTKILC